MKKSILVLSVAAALGAVSGSASAAPVPGLEFNPRAVGHILIVPYFSTQGGNATLLNIYNTDTINGKAVKVRFRGASNSDDIYDFQLFLSPGDVWTANISRAASGVSALVTSDKSCTVPASVNGEFITSRLNPALTAAELANETREGYVEILSMANITPSTATTSVFFATKHNTAGTAPCTRSILDNLAISDTRLAAPTTGLMANWTIINVPQTTTFSGEAQAIEARGSNGMAIAGKNVYWPQRADPVGVSDLLSYTADPLFIYEAIQAAQYDLPDLSTPYISGGGDAQDQANELSHSMAMTRVAGEYLSSASISATTDWVISKPTRRYYVAVDYSGPTLITNYDDNGVSSAVYYRASNTQLGNANNGGKDYQACTQVTGVAWWNREEGQPSPDGPVISPGQPKQPPWLCGEVSVLGVNSPVSPLGANVARTNVTIGTGFNDGWGLLTVTNGGLGLPMIVNQFSKAVNPVVAPGVSGTYGVNYPGRKVTGGVDPSMY